MSGGEVDCDICKCESLNLSLIELNVQGNILGGEIKWRNSYPKALFRCALDFKLSVSE